MTTPLQKPRSLDATTLALFAGAVLSNAFLPTILSELREITLLIQAGLYANQLTGIGFLLAFWRVPLLKRLLTGFALLVNIVLSLLYGFAPPQGIVSAEIVGFAIMWSVLSVAGLWIVFTWIRCNEVQKIRDYTDRLAKEFTAKASDLRQSWSDQQRVSLKYILGMMVVIAVSLTLYRGLSVQLDRWNVPFSIFIFYSFVAALVIVLITGACVLAFASALAEVVEYWILGQLLYMFVFFVVVPAILARFNPALFAFSFVGFFTLAIASWVVATILRSSGLRFTHYADVFSNSAHAKPKNTIDEQLKFNNVDQWDVE